MFKKIDPPTKAGFYYCKHEGAIYPKLYEVMVHGNGLHTVGIGPGLPLGEWWEFDTSKEKIRQKILAMDDEGCISVGGLYAKLGLLKSKIAEEEVIEQFARERKERAISDELDINGAEDMDMAIHELQHKCHEETFEQEMATYEQERANLINAGHEGRFAVIKGEKIYGCWDTFHDALQHGYTVIGLTPFMVKEVLWKDRVYHI
jgi:hypothetical protein